MVPKKATRARFLATALACALLGPALPPGAARAQELPLDRWPSERADDLVALQHGAKIFVNYCLNCHSASLMRWNRLREIGIDEAQIKTNLIFSDQKVGETMTVAMNSRDAKHWFGKAPPDLSVIVRARNTAEHRGTDYLYTLFRGFYRDRSTITGWNNIVYPNISMPSILWQLQGPRAATLTRTEISEPAAGGKSGGGHIVRTVSAFDADGNVQRTQTELTNGSTGEEVAFTPADPERAAAYDRDVADLVAYLNWMSEPTAASRYKVGVWVMGFLVVFLLVAHWLNKVFWRDIK